MATLTTLPLELTTQIASFLDKATLKSCRLASRRATLFSAATLYLFETIAIRLGTPVWHPDALQRRLLDFEEQHNTASTINWEYVKTLIIDSRRVEAIDKEFLSTYKYVESEDGKTYVPNKERPPMTDDDQKAFGELVEKVVEAGETIRDIIWHTSNKLTPASFVDVACVITEAADERPIALHADLQFSDFTNTIAYMDCIENLTSLRLSFDMFCWANNPILGIDEELACARAITKSKNLRRFSLHVEKFPFEVDRSLNFLWNAITISSTLEEIHVGPLHEGFEEHNWGKLTNLKKLTSSDEAINNTGGIDSYGMITDQLWDSEIRLEEVRTQRYTPTISNYLIRLDTGLTAIDIECHVTDITTAENLAKHFWFQVVEAGHGKTLKKLRVWNKYQGGWTWCYPRQPARYGVAACKQLEELTICCIHYKRNFTLALLKEVSKENPKIKVFNLEFCGMEREIIDNVKDTAKKLDEFSFDDKHLEGREIQVRYKATAKKPKFSVFLEKRPPPGGEPDYFDYMWCVWNLGKDDRTPGNWKWERADDVYGFDDRFEEL